MPVQGDSPQLLELFIDPPEAERSMLPLITRRPILTRDALQAQAEASGAAAGGLTCFSSFVAGSGSLHTSMQRIRALPFRYLMATHQCCLRLLLLELSFSLALLQVKKWQNKKFTVNKKHVLK